MQVQEEQCKAAHPLCGTLRWQGLNPVKLTKITCLLDVVDCQNFYLPRSVCQQSWCYENSILP